MDDWRVLLYYPLGILPSIFFTLRFLIQWVKSEQEGVSYVDALFWRLSLAGNLLLLSHYLIQGQGFSALIQTGNAVISWRNLNLLRRANRAVSLRTVIVTFLGSFAAVMLIGWFLSGGSWMDFTHTYQSKIESPKLFWHIMGAFGQLLFASRFWIQWWECEAQKKSHLGEAFWWCSLIGSLISIVYFIQIRDVISIGNQSFGIIPYIRNLMLMRKKKVA